MVHIIVEIEIVRSVFMKLNICILSMLITFTASAQNAIWQNGSGNFTDTTHWNTGTIPGFNDSATFPDGSYTVSFTRDETNSLAYLTSSDSSTQAFDLNNNTWSLTNGFVNSSGALNSTISVENGSLIAGGQGINISCFNDTLPSYLTLEDVDSDLSALVLNNAHMTINGGYHSASERIYITSSASSGSKITSLTLTNATLVANNSFWCGNGNTSTGIVNVLSGSSLIASNHFSVGDQRTTAVGIVNVNGGDVFTHQANWVGNAYGATAYINLYDGSFTSSGGFELGHRVRAKAYLNISGGKFTAKSNMYLGNYQGDNGIGNTTGTVTITGGELQVNGEMHLGRYTNCYGSVVIDGVSTSTLNSVKAGYGPAGYGEFLLSNGDVNLSSDMEIGTHADSEGVVAVAGGSLDVGGNAYAGHNGTGTMNINGGTATFNNAFTAGNYNGSDGTANINDGIVTFKSNLHIGRNSGASGVVTINGGVVSNTATAYIGNVAGAKGTLSINGGDFYSSSPYYIGNFGTGSLNLSGGNTAIMNQIYVGSNNGSTGTVTISGGTFTNKQEIFVGYTSGSTGTMNISGGTNYFTSVVKIGDAGNATLNISGGETIITGERINSATSTGSKSRINISGGHLNVIKDSSSYGYLDIGGRGECVMEMTGGFVETEVLRIGPSGGSTPPVSKLIMNGGRLNVYHYQYLADTAGGTGVVHLIDGVLSVKQLRGWWGTLNAIFDGGTLEARGSNTSTFITDNNGGTPLGHVLTARGLVIDSNGYSVGTGLELPDAAGENGKLTKKGVGRFVINGVTSFTGPIAVEEGEVELNTGGMVTLAGGVQIDGGAWLDLHLRDQDFSMGASSASRIDGTVEMASGRELIFPATSSLTGTGTLERVTMQSGSTLVKNKNTGESTLSIANLTIDAGTIVELTGYTQAEFEEGITFIGGTNLDLPSDKDFNFTLNDTAYDWVAVTTAADGSGGYTVSAKYYDPGTVIVVR